MSDRPRAIIHMNQRDSGRREQSEGARASSQACPLPALQGEQMHPDPCIQEITTQVFTPVRNKNRPCSDPRRTRKPPCLAAPSHLGTRPQCQLPDTFRPRRANPGSLCPTTLRDTDPLTLYCLRVHSGRSTWQGRGHLYSRPEPQGLARASGLCQTLHCWLSK